MMEDLHDNKKTYLFNILYTRERGRQRKKNILSCLSKRMMQILCCEKRKRKSKFERKKKKDEIKFLSLLQGNVNLTM